MDVKLVMVSSSVQAAVTKYQRGGLDNRNLLFTALAVGSVRSRCQHGDIPVRAHFLLPPSH